MQFGRLGFNWFAQNIILTQSFGAMTKSFFLVWFGGVAGYLPESHNLASRSDISRTGLCSAAAKDVKQVLNSFHLED